MALHVSTLHMAASTAAHTRAVMLSTIPQATRVLGNRQVPSCNLIMAVCVEDTTGSIHPLLITFWQTSKAGCVYECQLCGWLRGQSSHICEADWVEVVRKTLSRLQNAARANSAERLDIVFDPAPLKYTPKLRRYVDSLTHQSAEHSIAAIAALLTH